MKKRLLWGLAVSITITTVVGCTNSAKKDTLNGSDMKNVKYSDFTFDVNPETFEIFVEKDGKKESASVPLPKMEVSDLDKKQDAISWTYPEEKIQVNIEKEDKYLDINITSTGAEQFSWPKISADGYTLPIAEGKYIPSNDANWKRFLKDETMTWSESFSMNFFALNKADYSIMYIVKNMFNNEVDFDTTSDIQMQFTHQFPSIDKEKEYGFQLYVTENDPVHIAKLYKKYIVDKGEFKTLAQKEKENPDVKKLYGAPHIYIWNEGVLTEENVDWKKLSSKLSPNFTNWIIELLDKYSEDKGTEFKTVTNQLKEQDYADNYQKNVILKAFKNVVKMEQFYNPVLFEITDKNIKELLNKGADKLSEQKLYEVNKFLLKSVLGDAVDPIEEWGQRDANNVLSSMSKSGIKNAWIGLPNWSNGLMNPSFFEEGKKLGYLIGPYDSYHSIHNIENKDWNTAWFEDASLYENATIENKNGEKIGGFLQRGRKLNPTLSMPSVKQRMDAILENGIQYNSWFIDVDAAGEFHDDYSKSHRTTQPEDMKARLDRMKYIADKYGMVIGSEGGNDYASSTIAFAHGIETPVIKWSDEDMRKNKDSEYYVGAYYSNKGTIPERYAKQVPLKELYKHVYIDPAYNLPLFKLVYNDSVITSHHWEWPSLKIEDEVANRMLSELLYNVPPMYHLDMSEWNKDKDLISSYIEIWAPLHEKAVQREMTDFRILSDDRLVQSTKFGSDLKVTVNFSTKDFNNGEEEVKAKSAVICDGKSKKSYDLESVSKK